MNALQYRKYINSLMRPQYKWLNLPEGITSLQIEMKLQEKGNIAVVPFNKNWAAESYVMSSFDIYKNPIKIMMVSINNKLTGKKFDNGDCYYLYHNSNKSGVLDIVGSIITDLVKIEKRIMENIDMNRLQLFIDNIGTKKGDNSKEVKSLIQRIKNGDIVIALQSGIMNKDNIKSLGEFVEDNSLNLWENYFNQWTKLTKILGISVNETNYKKANVNSGEIGVSKEAVQRVIQDQVNQREDFITRISKEHSEWAKVEIELLTDMLEEKQMEQENKFSQQEESNQPEKSKPKEIKKDVK